MQIYSTFRARKGKACVLSVTAFGEESPTILDGYNIDVLKLKHLWYQTGFDVVIPTTGQITGLTANVSAEIYHYKLRY